ncbi:MAG: hypothetical protein M3O73_00235 [Actinomycetota bacterium]|nr:hypothetical protein [Actinomycetota bacterium]
MTRVGILGAPRPMPRSWVPMLGGCLVIVLALPVFLVAGWRLSGWGIAAIIWTGVQGFGLLLARFRPSPENLAGSGVLAFGMMIRMLAVLVVLLVVASSDGKVGLAAALVYGLAYTAELGLSLAGYFSQEPTA